MKSLVEKGKPEARKSSKDGGKAQNTFGITDFLADLVAPTVCPFCGDFIVWNSFACEKCQNAAVKNPLREPPDFCEKVFSAFLYDELAQKAVYRFKYRHNTLFAGLSAEIIVGAEGFSPEDFDLLVPVPMHSSKLYSRYYNPAWAFAKRIKRHTGILISPFALFREKTKTDQHKLDQNERVENAAKIYSMNRADEIKGKRILLCDDVMTTGATIGVCAKLLVTAGARTVSAAVCAATQKFSGD
jgi:ComF family protein